MDDIDQTLQRLQSFGNGASAHTANKARCYIGVFREKDPTTAAMLVRLAEAAMNTSDWKPLALVMGRWW